MIQVGVVGATGYAGLELVRLLSGHPQVKIAALTSRREAGCRVDALFPHLRGVCDLSYAPPDDDALDHCDVVFFATPHGVAMQAAPELLARGQRIIDLSADFRLRDPGIYAQWYGQSHACPDLLAEAVYGLPERHRDAIRKARVVGNPGCYPTSVQLGLLPLLETGVIDPSHVIADCKSGVSGAGREAKVGLLLCEAGDNFKAYGVAGHRHGAEIKQGLEQVAGRPVGLTFVPHLTPMIRGIHATLYAQFTVPDVDLQALFEKRFATEPFVDVMPAGSHPETRSVRGNNLCRLAVYRPEGGNTVVVLSVIDNLVKGAAGQAVQCLNLMCGFDERSGLPALALWP